MAEQNNNNDIPNVPVSEEQNTRLPVSNDDDNTPACRCGDPNCPMQKITIGQLKVRMNQGGPAAFLDLIASSNRAEAAAEAAAEPEAEPELSGDLSQLMLLKMLMGGGRNRGPRTPRDPIQEAQRDADKADKKRFKHLLTSFNDALQVGSITTVKLCDKNLTDTYRSSTATWLASAVSVLRDTVVEFLKENRENDKVSGELRALLQELLGRYTTWYLEIDNRDVEKANAAVAAAKATAAAAPTPVPEPAEKK